MNRLVVSRGTWDRIRQHLLADESEHLCFLLAEHVDLGNTKVLLERELQLIDDRDLEGGGGWDSLSLKLEPLLRVMNRANQLQCALVEAHSHPFASGGVTFSALDLRGQREMVAYLADVAPSRAYGALVLGRNAVRGQVWLPGKKESLPLHQVRVVGPVLEDIEAEGGVPATPASAGANRTEDLYQRQVLALGASGQMKIGQTSVGIVGVGGVGSIVAQELVYLGVREFLLIDDDLIEATNLHRLVGASPRDVGKRKTEVAKDHLKRVNPAAQVKAVYASVRSAEALLALKGSDVIFGCVDTDSGRLILNELANAYLTPYIDCGVGIEVEEGMITQAGGRVVVWVPGRPCLLCAGEINTRIAAEELESPQEREFRRRHGYVAGADAPAAAVISLNGTLASLAVTEFVALVTGFRASSHYTYYDMVEQRAGPRVVKNEHRCTACALRGLGDKANLFRYSRVGPPDDMPEV